jgi:hypothetical protein
MVSLDGLAEASAAECARRLVRCCWVACIQSQEVEQTRGSFAPRVLRSRHLMVRLLEIAKI